jgi:hypothetical protein
VLRPRGQLRFFEHVRAESAALRRVQTLLDATVWPTRAGGCHAGRGTAAAIESAGFAIEDDRVNALVLSRQAIRRARDDIDRSRCPGRILQGFAARVRFGLDGHHSGHAWRVVCEVRRLQR